MTEAPACLQCASPVAADAPEGLCPNCLLGLASAVPVSSPNGTTPHPNVGFIAPAAGELAHRFPQLEILELLGQGGMGAVYKARQKKLDRLVAVKILPPEWGNDPAFAERFAREAKALARLTHPHIVAVHDFGESEGLYYLVMEYVDGANLRQILAQGRLKPSEALTIIPQICDALQFAHEEGIVHRDIKPENILLDSKGRVKIADFGLAKLLGQPRAVFTLTGSQQVMGTLDYMAPEQRLRPLEVDHRADIYSLGVVFYEMLTGELPLGRFEAPSQKAQIDMRLDEVVFRALEREPERRYQRASHVKNDLESIVGGQAPPIHVDRPQAARPVAHAAVADTFPIVAPAAGMILAGVVGILFWTVLGLSLFAAADFKERPAFLLMPLIALPAGIGLIIGAGRMMRCQSYHWAMGSAIWAMIPWSPGWLIGLPCGIISLVVLRRPETQAAFGLSSRQRNPLMAPAIGLLLTGFAAWIFWTILGLSLFATYSPSYYAYYRHDSFGRPVYVQEYGPRHGGFFFLLMPLLATAAAAVLVIGARKMMRRRSYQFCVLTAIWGMIPWSPFWVMGLPFGILALRALKRRDVQLSFGLPFQAGQRAFERPLAFERPVPQPRPNADPARPTPVPAAAPPQPTGPVRRGVRDFIGSMYSLMFHSRMETPRREPQETSAQRTGPVAGPAVQSEAAIPWAVAANEPKPEDHDPADPSHPGRQGHSLWLVLLFCLGIFFAASLVIVILFTGRSMVVPMKSTTAIKTDGREPRGLLQQKHLDLQTTLGLPQWQGDVIRDIALVFRSSEEEYMALEARFTKRQKVEGRPLKVTILPFTDERNQLEKRFWAKLEVLLSKASVVQATEIARKQLPDGSLFPFGKEEVTIELWRDNELYHGKVFRGEATDKPVEEFSNPKLPLMYERFWVE
jgi:tRNA A-37 threonylcarbamoyl transferase component Bud32